MRIHVLCIIFLLGACTQQSEKKFQNTSKVDASDTYFEIVKNTKQSFTSKHPIDIWMLDSYYQARSNGSITGKAVRDSLLLQLPSFLEGYTTISEVREIKNLFRLWIVGFAYQENGMIASTSIENELDHALRSGKQFIEYSLMSKDLIGYGMAGYSHDGLLSMPAIQWGDERWRDAILIHELNHARLDYHGKLPRNIQAVQNELDCHYLEFQVLNQSTFGAYGRMLQEIVSSKIISQSYKEFVSQISLNDLIKLDSLFEMGGYLESDLRGSQFYTDLIRTWSKTQSNPRGHEVKAYLGIAARYTGVRYN